MAEEGTSLAEGTALTKGLLPLLPWVSQPQTLKEEKTEQGHGASQGGLHRVHVEALRTHLGAAPSSSHQDVVVLLHLGDAVASVE